MGSKKLLKMPRRWKQQTVMFLFVMMALTSECEIEVNQKKQKNTPSTKSSEDSLDGFKMNSEMNNPNYDEDLDLNEEDIYDKDVGAGTAQTVHEDIEHDNRTFGNEEDEDALSRHSQKSSIKHRLRVRPASEPKKDVKEENSSLEDSDFNDFSQESEKENKRKVCAKCKKEKPGFKFCRVAKTCANCVYMRQKKKQSQQRKVCKKCNEEKTGSKFTVGGKTCYDCANQLNGKRKRNQSLGENEG